jgi:hypothetical protein
MSSLLSLLSLVVVLADLVVLVVLKKTGGQAKPKALRFLVF